MRLLTPQEVLARKAARQRAIPGLEVHASGHCVHLGRISPGCHKCFVADDVSANIPLGPECNAACPYCYGGLRDRSPSSGEIMAIKAMLLQKARKCPPSGVIPTISFTGGGEPLLSIDLIERYMQYCKSIEHHMGRRPWYYLCTNGLLADEPMPGRLRDMGFDEIRFHLGASNFSEKVYRHMEHAVRLIPVVTVETPAWPPHRERLFAMLSRLADIGVSHLNVGEIEIDHLNKESILRALPDAEVYHYHSLHPYDGGLVYDLMEEVAARGYPFSVLDCNSQVKSFQRSPGKWVLHEPLEGVCAEPPRS